MGSISQAINEIYQTGLTNHVNQYLYVFIPCIIFAFVFERVNAKYKKSYHYIESKIVNFLQKRELFYVHDAAREEIWLNILRIIAGFTLLDRSFWIFYYEVLMGGSLTRELTSFVDMISSLFFMLGFLTPIFNAVLFLFHTYIHDNLLATYTLGSCLAQILLMIFMFLPAGRRCSIDAVILRSHSFLSRFVSSIYSFVGVPTTNRISIVKLCAFLSYGLLCMYSVYEHFRDPYWAGGIANVMLLSSNWLVAPYELFRHLFSTYGKPAIILSMITLYIMMAWEFVIIPFTLIKGPTRLFVIWWGLAFFAVSLFILQLSWLPYYQIILFAILFWPGYFLNRDGSSSIELYYDDKCNLCDRTVSFVKLCDWFSVVLLRPLSKNQELIERRGLTQDAVYNDLCGFECHSKLTYKGYDLYVQLTKIIPMLFIFYPLLMLGRILKIGPRIYSFIALRRRKLFGVCLTSNVKFNHVSDIELQSPVISQRNSFFSAYLLTYVIFLAVYMINFPYFAHIPGWQILRKSFDFVSATAPAINGQIPIKVFTPEVISMGSHYFTVTGVFNDGSKKLLPYVGENGERLSLVRSSDRLYFGHALRWRRLMYGKEGQDICYNSDRDDTFLSGLFMLSEHIWHARPDHFQLDYYSQGVPDPKAAANYEYRLPGKKHICTISAQYVNIGGDNHKIVIL